MSQPAVSESAFDSLVTVEGPPPVAPEVSPPPPSPADASSVAVADEEPAAPPPSESDRARDDQGRFTQRSDNLDRGDEPPAPQAQPPKRKESPQERINKAVKAQRDAEREAAYYRDQWQRAQQAPPPSSNGGAAGTRPARPSDEAEPSFEQFANEADPYAAYVRALGRYEARQEIRQAQQSQQQQYSVAQQQQRIAKHQSDLRALRDTTPDFDSLVDVIQASPWTEELSQAVLATDDSARLTLYLAQHPDQFTALARMNGPGLYRALGRLEASLGAANGPTPQARPQPAITPIQPVGSSPVSTTPAPEDVEDFTEFVRRNNKAYGTSNRGPRTRF